MSRQTKAPDGAKQRLGLLLPIGGGPLVNAHGCCEAARKGSECQMIKPGTRDRESQPPGFARRCLGTAGWMAPAAILALVPKCPACLAMYIALGTGIGLSMSTAFYLRLLLIILCVAVLLYLATGRLRRFITRVKR
jgi:hypothetical protein